MSQSEKLRIDSGMRQGCIMSPCPYNVYGCSDKRGEDGDRKEGRGMKVNIGKSKVMLWKGGIGA